MLWRLFAPGVEKQFPHLRGFCDVADEPLT
jgi:hypothetical protein